MGMFDTFGDDNQVKIFTVPYIMGGYVHFSGGSLKYFIKGDKVPYKTWWYNLGKNFLIINRDPLDNQFYLHVISEGVYKDTYKNSLPTGVWQKTGKIYTKYGTEVKIEKNNEALLNYISDYERYDEERELIFKKYNDANSRLFEYWSSNKGDSDREKLSNLLEEANKENKEQNKELDKLYEKYLKKYNLASRETEELIGGYLNYLSKVSEGNVEELVENLNKVIDDGKIVKENYYDLLDISEEDRVLIDNLILKYDIKF